MSPWPCKNCNTSWQYQCLRSESLLCYFELRQTGRQTDIFSLLLKTRKVTSGFSSCKSTWYAYLQFRFRAFWNPQSQKKDQFFCRIINCFLKLGSKTNVKIYWVIFCFSQIESKLLKIRFYDPINRLFWNLIDDQFVFYTKYYFFSV